MISFVTFTDVHIIVEGVVSELLVAMRFLIVAIVITMQR